MKRLGFLFLVLSIPASVLYAQRAPVWHPDVFLVTIDTLRADHVGCYGYAGVQTPALDFLARDGARFSSAFTASPITNSSHATILTGDLPTTHGVMDFAIPLNQSTPTWAELLKKSGYHTAAFIGAAILDSKALAPGFDRGFDYYDNFPEHPASSSRWGRVERRGMDVVRDAERWLDAHGRGPRFAWVHLYDPHDPYEPPPPYSQTYKERPYDGEIAYADSALGTLLAYLKKTGAYENALIVVVGDHGEGLGEHGEDTHGIFLYDSTLHVPLIIKQPAQRAGARVVNAQVRTTDILPTVLDLLGVTASAKFDGASLKPLLTGHEGAELTALGQTDYPLRFGWAPLRSVRAGGYKFIEAPRPELYDLRQDRGELKNVYEPWDPQVKNARAALTGIRSAPSSPNVSAAPVGQGTLDELRALGYLGPEGSTNVPEPSLLPDPKDKINEQNLLHKAMLAADDGRSADARAALRQLLQSDPKSAPALAQLGRLELEAANDDVAAGFLARAHALSPDDSSVSLNLGRALKKKGDLEGAKSALLDSLRSNPKQPAARIALGEVLLALKDFGGAEDQLSAVLLVEPDNAAAHLSLGQVKLAESKPAEAVNELKAAVRLHPDAWAYRALSEAYGRTGQKQLAEQAARRAAALSSPASK
jgi:choline-sulfatase